MFFNDVVDAGKIKLQFLVAAQWGKGCCKNVSDNMFAFHLNFRQRPS